MRLGLVIVVMVGVLVLASCGDEEEGPIRLRAECSPAPAQVVACTWVVASGSE